MENEDGILENDNKKSASSVAARLLQGLMYLYFVSVMFMAPYYNWEYAKQHGFVKWLLLGEVVATGKSLI